MEIFKWVEEIEKIYEDSTDLSVSISDVSFGKDTSSLSRKGYNDIPIKIKIHNNTYSNVLYISYRLFIDLTWK